ncbi:MAG: adaptor protein MecA [Clostridia bacterium]|nr:adaptor protein MecA [Clostridia bacterium]
MELLLVSDSKLKVMLTVADMEKYDLRVEEIDYDNTHTRRALWEILDEAKKQTGFDAASDKVLIQLYPSKDGGCELFVTKLGLIPPVAERTIARSNRVTMLAARQGIYRFESFFGLIGAIRAIENITPHRDSDVYLGDDGKYYLIIDERVGKSGSFSEFSRILEYSERASREMIDYIKEHGKRLTEGDAVEKLSKL